MLRFWDEKDGEWSEFVKKTILKARWGIGWLVPFYPFETRDLSIRKFTHLANGANGGESPITLKRVEPLRV